MQMNGKTRNGWSRSVQRITPVMFAIVLAAAVMLNFLPSHPEFDTKTLSLLFGIFAVLCVTFYFGVIWVFQRPAVLSKRVSVSSKELRRKRQRFYGSLPK
jgi:hypothetical protein